MLRVNLRRRRDEAGAAMLLVVMCMLVAMMLTTALLGVVMSEAMPTAYQAKAARTVHAAEAGVQAAISGIRSATSAQPGLGTLGDVAKLPCYSTPAPLTGSVSGGQGTLGTASYRVTVRYYIIDPSGQTPAWRASHALTCVTGSGPSSLPLYALIESSAAGTGGAGLPASFGNRSMELVYSLQGTDSGTMGGPIVGGSNLCWTAPSVTPAAGQVLTLKPCTSGDVTQQFAYRADYSLVLAITQSATVAGTGGMCVAAGTASPGAAYLDQMTSRANNLTATGGVTSTTGPLTGGTATSVDGTTGWLGAALPEPSPGPGPFTMAIRVKSSVSGMIMQYGNTIGQAPSQYDRHLYLDSSGKLVFGVYSGGYRTLVSGGSLRDGAWHAVVASVGAAGQKLYVDGTLVASAASVTVAEVFSGYWHLGWGMRTGWPNIPTSNYWNGALSHAAVWSSQLSNAQVATLTSASSDSALRSAITTLAPRSYWPLGVGTGTVVSLQTCDVSNAQKWSYNDNGKFEGLKADGSNLSDQCLTGQTPVASGTPLILVTCGSAQQWTPDPTVGAGAAGEGTFQFVNFAEYGRCLDVTNQNVDLTYLINYPCKQDPSHPVTWNQRWIWDGTGTKHFQTTSNSKAYCLTAPSVAGGMVTTKLCGSGRTDQVWTRNGRTVSRTTDYTLVSATGKCLDLVKMSGWSQLVVNTCSGTFSQKWNAPPQTADASILTQRETTTG